MGPWMPEGDIFVSLDYLSKVHLPRLRSYDKEIPPGGNFMSALQEKTKGGVGD